MTVDRNRELLNVYANIQCVYFLFKLSIKYECECFMQTPRSMSLSSYFNRLRAVWILDESFFQVFDKASQSINNSWRNSKRQLVNL